jgi:ABC-type lipoprotein release transport system permease subunit
LVADLYLVHYRYHQWVLPIRWYYTFYNRRRSVALVVVALVVVSVVVLVVVLVVDHLVDHLVDH